MSAKGTCLVHVCFKKIENWQKSVKYRGVCKFGFADLYECMSGNVLYMRNIPLRWI